MYKNADKVKSIQREKMHKDGLNEVLLTNKIKREKLSGSTMGVTTNLSFIAD
jgi:hypothetical protein